MKFLKFIILSLLITLVACADNNDGANGGDGEDYTPGTVYRISGKIQKGACKKDGEIIVLPINANMDQNGYPAYGFTKDDFGNYDIPAESSELWVESFFEGLCYNEVTGGEGVQRLSAIAKVTDEIKNINPLTKIRSMVARVDSTGDIETRLINAESKILDYLGMPELSKRFTEMNLEQAGIQDAVLALTNSMILNGRNVAEQGDFIVQIGNGVIENDLTLKAEIATAFQALPLIQIKNNLENHYADLGLDIDVPPIWRLGAPDYYADLLERDPIVISTFNLADNTRCNFEMNVYNSFAIPFVFDSAIEFGKYIALNLDGDISIWTHSFDEYDRPGVKILDIERLNEVILDDPIKMSYNGLLGGDHGLIAGVEYYIVIRRDEGWALSTSCVGGFLPFGRKLFSGDEGLTWIGNNNNTPWFRKSGVKMYTTN